MSKDIFINKADIENDDLQIKTLLKENDNLKVPNEISTGIDAVLIDLNSDVIKKTPKKINIILSKVAIVALIALSITIVTSIVNPTLVRAMPVVGKIFDFFSGESANKFNDASVLIGLYAKDKGITVTLEEASMDSEKFMATLKVTGKSFDTNNIDVEVGGSANNSGFSPSSRTIKRIDDTTVVVLFEGTLSDINISEKVHLYLYIGGILIDGKEINGDWNFSTTIDADEILVPSKEIKSTDEVTIEDYNVSIEKFTTSPLSTNVNAKCVFNNYDFLNKSETDIHNDSNELFTVGYIFKDSLGNILLSKEIESSCDLNTMEYNMKSEILGDLSYSEYIDVIPVLRGKAEMSYYDENGDMLYQCISDSPQAIFEKISIDNIYYNIDINNQFLSIDELKGKIIEVNDTGNVAIKDVEATDSYTKITINISDYYDIRFLGFMEIIDEGFNVCINEVFNMGPVVENSSEKEISVTLPPLDKSKKYTISLPRILDLNIDDSNKIRVNLN
ncbi:MAG: DUF4179 domain-containing protein [Clostridium sp.]|uniref:DUF4179 domain-containing protein n=1 Tax=Clostridium sp. TaxID=1506 RepID=UPI00301F7850